ncbi:hypothetical protein [Burkholderia sp. PU8-34]
MSILLGVAKSKPTRYSLVAVAAISLAAVCGTGIAAFAGLLPASDSVADAVTATPLIDMQVDASVNAGRNHGLSSCCDAPRHEAP